MRNIYSFVFAAYDLAHHSSIPNTSEQQTVTIPTEGPVESTVSNIVCNVSLPIIGAETDNLILTLLLQLFMKQGLGLFTTLKSICLMRCV